ncbi:hypothetical protein LCGC14_0892000 [marine sediment metagenome]|uniref:Uncharacterized protein n=1 Tax=marine sediment metagenome TaxID=412755 RepID=A0A0F9PJK4_9ZZZZ
MKKPTVSEIRAREQAATEAWKLEGNLLPRPRAEIRYLLKLVERMGRIIRDDVNPISEIDTIRVRALLLEIKE